MESFRNALNPAINVDLIFTNVLSKDEIVGTGTILEVYVKEEKVEAYTIVIFGDVNGDGLIGLDDLVSVRNDLLEFQTINNQAYKFAGDLYSEGNITLNGLVGIMAYISESATINQNTL